MFVWGAVSTPPEEAADKGSSQFPWPSVDIGVLPKTMHFENVNPDSYLSRYKVVALVGKYISEAIVLRLGVSVVVRATRAV